MVKVLVVSSDTRVNNRNINFEGHRKMSHNIKTITNYTYYMYVCSTMELDILYIVKEYSLKITITLL